MQGPVVAWVQSLRVTARVVPHSKNHPFCMVPSGHAGVAVGGKEVKAVNELPCNGGGVPFLI